MTNSLLTSISSWRASDSVSLNAVALSLTMLAGIRFLIDTAVLFKMVVSSFCSCNNCSYLGFGLTIMFHHQSL